MKSYLRLSSVVLLGCLAACPLDAQWTRTDGRFGSRPTCLAVSGSDIFAGTLSDGVFRSSNNGLTWTAVEAGMASHSWILTLATVGQNLFAGVYNGGAYLSTNSGVTWSQIDSGLTYKSLPVYAFASNVTNLFAGTGGEGIFQSTNSGAVWTPVSTGLNIRYVGALTFSGATLVAGSNFGVSFSPDSGAQWSLVKIGLPGQLSVVTFLPDGPNLYAGTLGGGVYLSSDQGRSWRPVNSNLTNHDVRTMAISGNVLYAGTEGGGVFRSRDSAATWTSANTGLLSTMVYGLAISAGYLFAGTDSGVFRRPLSEIAGVTEAVGVFPVEFNLHQNYPNPFNPATTIPYSLPHRSHVMLAVFNTLGQIVAELVNSDIDAGYHEVQFNASDLASGVYFYRLQAGSYVGVKKMLILR